MVPVVWSHEVTLVLKYGVAPSGLPMIETATEESLNTRGGVERCLRFAFELAKKRRGGKPWKGLKPEDVAAGKKSQLTLCGKTNVLTFAFDLWERAFHEAGQKDFAGVKRDYAHVDATTMWFVKNPEWFEYYQRPGRV